MKNMPEFFHYCNSNRNMLINNSRIRVEAGFEEKLC